MSLLVPSVAAARPRDVMLRRVLVSIPTTVVVIVAGLVALSLLQDRKATIAAGEQLIASYAQLAEEQTSRTIQSVDHTLETAQVRLRDTDAAGNAAAIDAGLRELTAGRPFLRAIRVLDTSGRVVFSTDGSNGLDLSGRPFLRRYRDDATTGFLLNPPLRSSTSPSHWFLPATRPWLDAAGTVRGVIVAGLEPSYFTRVWTLADRSGELSIALFRADGVLLMRAPFVDDAMGRSFDRSAAFARPGSHNRTYRTVSAVDGRERLIHYRRLSTHADLVVIVGLDVGHVLAPWHRHATVLTIGGAIAAVALIALALWLTREWKRRHDTEARYRLLFDSNPHPMWVFDTGTLAFLAVNRAAVERYGWSRREFRGMTLADIRPPEERAQLDAVLARPDLGSSPTPYLMKHRTRDGTLLDVEITMRPLELEGRHAGVVLAQDVTERTRAAQARQVMEERLRQAQKMEAVGQMTGGIAHDFNNLLAVIIMKMEMMQDDLPADSPLVEAASGALAAANRGADLVARLLAFSRRRELNAVRTDIGDLLRSFQPLIKAAVPQVHLKVEAAPDLRACMVDRTGLETALLNLSVNARDAMPPGGSLTISARNRAIGEDEVQQRAGLVAGDWVEIAVHDNGSGIAPEVQSQIFEPFFTTKAEGKGTGLGLSMVFAFITQSGGFIALDSTVGEGTTFRLHLPVIH